MIGLLVLIIFLAAIVVAGFVSEMRALSFAVAAMVGAIGLGVLTVNQVDEGNAAVPVTFGKAGEAVGPGVHFAAPWTTYEELSTRERVINFSGDSPEREAAGLDDITMQTRGGGGFDLDARVRISLPRSAATNVWKTIGTSWEQAVVIPSGRECLRDSAVELDLTEAITTARPQIANAAEECLILKLTEPYGIRVIGVELGGTTVPAEVQSSINAKQGAEQARQAALIGLEQARIDAQKQSVEAKATSDAEQIIACGATIASDGSIVPNEICEDQFSDEYLDWLYINQLQNVDTLIVVDREIASSGSVIIDTTGSAGSSSVPGG